MFTVITSTVYHNFPSIPSFLSPLLDSNQPLPPQTLPGPALTPSSPAPFGGFLQILAGLLHTFLSGPLFIYN